MWEQLGHVGMDAGSGVLHCGQGVPLSLHSWADAVAERERRCGIRGRGGTRAGGRVTRRTRGTKDALDTLDTLRVILCRPFIFQRFRGREVGF